jgi:transcriptional regulator GlxA family with amidase domain
MAMDVCVLAFKGCTSLSSIGPLDLLWTAARMGDDEASGAAPFFNVRLISAATNPLISPNGLPIHCHAALDEVERADLVIVPAFDGDVLRQLEDNRDAVRWVAALHAQGADVASICTGAFVLAEAGLLDGTSATTHWIAQDLFRQRYPRVTMMPEQIIVDHGRICTSGGATSFLTLTAYLVEKYRGPEAARLLAKIFLIDLNKGPQTAYAIFRTQKAHGDRSILEAQEMIERQGLKDLSVVDLASRVNMSSRNFIRRFKAATGNTPIEYMQRVRIEAAKHALESGDEPVDAVASTIGYEDVGSFRAVFKRVTGVTPAEYRRRYRFYHA